jgi:hypothetical protein
VGQTHDIIQVVIILREEEEEEEEEVVTAIEKFSSWEEEPN